MHFTKGFEAMALLLLREMPVARAAKMLRETDLSLAAIAPRAGFQHVEYLSAAFRQHTGLTPTAYRRTCRGK